MKPLKNLPFIILLAALCGCATREHIVLDQAVGPAGPVVKAPDRGGQLVVYSAMEVVDPTDSYHTVHSGYRIYDQHGLLRRWVDNRTGPLLQDPKAVTLPAGRYTVEARGTNEGWVRVPVVIAENRTTMVNLAKGAVPVPVVADEEFVRLPDGKVVGARASSSP